MHSKQNQGFATKAVHAGEKPDFREGATGDVNVPIHLSTTFARRKVTVLTAGYEYTRCQNPTRKALETKLAAIENAAYGLVFASGMAAETTLLTAMLKSGDHIVAFDDLYGGTKRVFNDILNKNGITATCVDATDDGQVRQAIRPGETRMIWIESPSNPLLKVCDIRRIADIASTCGAILVVDNTFLSPYFQKPLDLGADIIVHSSTKYIGGHSDVLGGALLCNSPAYYETLQFHQNAIGAVLAPFDSYLTLRGIKTLALRMEQHQKNALTVARYLAQHPRVKRVLYPGLEIHPQHELSKTQATGFGGVLSFEIKGSQADAEAFVESLKVITLAESLGGVESLIEIPSSMTHSSVPKEIREQVGISDTLIRFSIGIEDIDDLIADLEQGLSNL